MVGGMKEDRRGRIEKPQWDGRGAWKKVAGPRRKFRVTRKIRQG